MRAMGAGRRAGVLGGVLAALVWATAGTPAVAEDPSLPNVLIVVTDDQRSETWGVLAETSSWLRDGGTTFGRAFATTPMCCPSRASLFTGRYAHNHGVHTTFQAGKLDHRSTLQRYLHDAGYRTAIFGKFLNSFPNDQDPPYFDTWATNPGWQDYTGTRWNVGGTVRTIDTYSTRYISNRAVRYIRNREANDDQPWLLYLTPLAPHFPFTPEAAYATAGVPPWTVPAAAREEDRSDKPPYVRASDATVRSARDVRADQLRTLMSVDDMVGRVMALLDDLGESDTIVVFVSDNGLLWADHGLTGKGAPYTGAIRVPMVLRWPGHVAAGAVDHRLVGILDIAPTILDAVGIEPDAPMDGRSLLGYVTRTEILVEYWPDPGSPTPAWASLRTAGYQFVEYYTADGKTVTFREYYDLVHDPQQLTNLLRDGDPSNDPDVPSLREALAEARSCSGDGCP